MSKLEPNERFKTSTSGFIRHLYEAYVRADSGNAARIQTAFPHLFQPYDVTEVTFKELVNV
jgi:hypothetical protein